MNASMTTKIQAHVDNEIAVSGASVGETVEAGVALAVPPIANNGSVVLVRVTVMVLAEVVICPFNGMNLLGVGSYL